MSNLIDVKAKLRAYVLGLALGVVDGLAETLAESWKFYGDGEIRGGGMADTVPDKVGECAHRKCKLICVPCITEEINYEISRTNVVSEIGEESIAKGIVANVLDDASTISKGASMCDLSVGQCGITTFEERNNGTVPGKVDELFVRQQRVPVRYRGGKQTKQDDNPKP